MKRSRRAQDWTVGRNYDETDVHLRYDKTRAFPEETMRLWLEKICALVPRDSIETIIDVGCGTGRFSAGLSERFSANVCGIDPSSKMLSAARRTVTSPRIQFVQASAQKLPLNDSASELVFISQVYHHIQDKNKAARIQKGLEAGRLSVHPNGDRGNSGLLPLPSVLSPRTRDRKQTDAVQGRAEGLLPAAPIRPSSAHRRQPVLFRQPRGVR